MSVDSAAYFHANASQVLTRCGTPHTMKDLDRWKSIYDMLIPFEACVAYTTILTNKALKGCHHMKSN